MSPPAVARPPGSPPHPFAVQYSPVFNQQEGSLDLRQWSEELDLASTPELRERLARILVGENDEQVQMGASPALRPRGGIRQEQQEVSEARQDSRRVRGLVGGEQEDITQRLDPEVPGPLPAEGLPDPEGWNMVDRLGVWECATSLFFHKENVPSVLKEKWGKVVAEVLRKVMGASTMLTLSRALKWYLLLPQAFLRQAKRGGQVGRSSVAARFNAACGGTGDMRLLISSWTRKKKWRGGEDRDRGLQGRRRRVTLRR